MKQLLCPLNGLRNISEFVCGGEITEMPDLNNSTDRDWAEYLFINENKKGIVIEWWQHIATSYWFIAERNTETNEIIRTYPATEKFNKRINFSTDNGA